jgi:hypothetical protein
MVNYPPGPLIITIASPLSVAGGVAVTPSRDVPLLLLGSPPKGTVASLGGRRHVGPGSLMSGPELFVLKDICQCSQRIAIQSLA